MTYYFEDLIVSLHKGGHLYIVNMIDTGFFIERELADMIAEENKENSYLIAALLAYIKRARQENNETIEKKEERDAPPTQGELLSAISSILEKYSIDEIIRRFRDLKWHEMKEIIGNKKPKEKMKHYMEVF